ncbi:MAG TPA: DUF3489 domain-containing protein [Salinarimonas sp.]|nr:DUF3489 domain-containing protein [Salinarimonas sp.]
MTTSPPLTDTQLVLLSRASKRADGLLVPLDTLRGGAAHTVASKLLIAELVTKVPVGREGPHWFRDEGAGRWLGLKVTASGLRAIGIEADEPDGAEDGGAHELGVARLPSLCSAVRVSPGREGTKRALVIGLLSRPDGAGMDELVEATGWLPHTTRAALTGLRQRGYTLAKSRDAGGRTVYRISGDMAPTTAEPGTAETTVASETGTVEA